MREQEIGSRQAIAEFSDIEIRIRALDSRYRKDCITDEDMAKEIQELRQMFTEKAKEMTSLFKNPFFKEGFVPNLVAKYKKKFEYKLEEALSYLDQLYADFANLHQRSLAMLLDNWADTNDEEAKNKIKRQLEMLDDLIKKIELRQQNYKNQVARQDAAAEKARKAEEKRQEQKKKEKPEEEKPEEDKKTKDKKKGKASKKLKGVILKHAPRSGSKIYYVKSSEAREKEASAQRAAQRAMSRPAHQPALAPRQMSR